MVERLSKQGSGVSISIGDANPSGYDIVVNGTSLGLHADDPLPLEVSRLDARQIVAEIIMNPETTPLLAAARARGCRVHPGWPMLACQLGMMADFMGLLAVPAPTAATAVPAAAE